MQGVGYRAWVMDEATARHLQGWVRNRRDRSVEAIFAGDELNVAAMIAACGKGPPMAHVDKVIPSDATEALLALRGGIAFATLPTV